MSDSATPASGDHIRIASEDEILVLDYAGALEAHGGDSIWGVAVAFRALQLAAGMLSRPSLWQREQIHIVSGHPGPGVRDALDYVTHCVSDGRFRLLPDCGIPGACSRSMRYQWWISDRYRTIAVRLLEGFVPEALYDLLDRRNAGAELPDDQARFSALKSDLATRIWRAPLTSSFLATQSASPLASGDLPASSEWA